MIDFDYDDLGDRDGTKFDDFGGAARSSIEKWKPTAYGQRPLDWAGRDVIYGAARRDRRNWQLGLLLKNKPPFLLIGTRHLPHKQSLAAANCRGFMFLYYMRILRIHAALGSRRLMVQDRPFA